jgi:hypothetical protein
MLIGCASGWLPSATGAEKHRVLSLLVSLNQFHMELRLGPGNVLELAPPLEVKLKVSETAVFRNSSHNRRHKLSLRR